MNDTVQLPEGWSYADTQDNVALPEGWSYADTPATLKTPSGMDENVYRKTLDHLVNTHADRAHVDEFVKSAGYDPAQIVDSATGKSGLDAAYAYFAAGGRDHVNVLPNINGVEQDTPQETQPPERTITDRLNMATGSVGHAISDIVDMPLSLVNLGRVGVNKLQDWERGVAGLEPINHDNEANPDTGMPTGVGAAGRFIDNLNQNAGFPVPTTNGEKLTDMAIRGGIGGLATGGEEIVPKLVSGVSGMASGGASEFARQQGGGAGMQLAAGLAGGLLAPASVAAGGRALQAIPGMAEREMTPTMQAFDNLKVPAMAADVGGVVPQALTATTKLTLGGLPLYRAGEEGVNATRTARGVIADKIGNKSNNVTAAGTVAQRGGYHYLDNSADEATKLYDAIPIAGASPATLSSTKAKLYELTAGLDSNPELSDILADPKMHSIFDAIMGKVVQEPTGLLDQAGNPIMRTVLKGGALNWQDLKTFRTRIGEKAGAPALQSDTPQANLKALYGALSDDMKATAKDAGALSQFNRANSFWRKRQKTIDNVITPILGKKLDMTPEASYRQIESWAGDRGSFIRTAQFLHNMPEEEANSIRATFFNRLGNATKGAQNADGDQFSPAVFMTQWNALKENSPKALNVLFPGAQYQKDIQDIVTVASSQKAAEKFANTSKTSLGMHAAPGVALLHDPVSLAIQYGAGRLLGYPGFARWLASSVKKPNAAAQLAHINKLAAIAAKQPSIAQDVLRLQEQLAGQYTNDPAPEIGTDKP